MTCLICGGEIRTLVKKRYCLPCRWIANDWKQAQRLAPTHPVSRAWEQRPSGLAAGTRAKAGVFPVASGPRCE